VEPGKQAAGFKRALAFGDGAEQTGAVVRDNKGF